MLSILVVNSRVTLTRYEYTLEIKNLNVLFFGNREFQVSSQIEHLRSGKQMPLGASRIGQKSRENLSLKFYFDI